MNLYKDLPTGPNPPQEINVVIEIPKGSVNKYEYNQKEGYFFLDRTLFSPLFYCFEYGFVPQTLSEDGDSLDVILITTYATFPGCVVQARPIGILRMKDEKGFDDKILAVPISEVDPRLKEIDSVKDLPSHLKEEISLFFADYKKLEKEKYKYVKVEGFDQKEKAQELIKQAVERYKKENN